MYHVAVPTLSGGEQIDGIRYWHEGEGSTGLLIRGSSENRLLYLAVSGRTHLVIITCHSWSYSQIRFYSRFRLLFISFLAFELSTIIAECCTFKSVETHTICGMQNKRQSRHWTLPFLFMPRLFLATQFRVFSNETFPRSQPCVFLWWRSADPWCQSPHPLL